MIAARRSQSRRIPLDTARSSCGREGDGTEKRPAMQIDLPPPRIPVEVGPPAPADPTFARFLRNVEVHRGRPGVTPDELTCDTLDLMLVPADKPMPPRRKPEQE